VKEQNPRAGTPVFPNKSFFLERKRIHNLLDKSLQSFVTVMIAGEGYGKTYAAASFLHKRPESIFWIQLSSRDNNPWHFWETVTKAVSFQNQEIKKIHEEFGFPETPRDILRYLSIEEKLSTGEKYIIVVDDLYLIHAKPVLHFMERILASPFANQNFLLISRNELQLNTIPLLSKGYLSKIDAGDLRFNEEEIASFFKINNIDVTPEDLRNIYSDTEGWALAVNLLANEIKGQGKNYTRQLLNTGAVRAMLDRNYRRMKAPLRKLLIEISFFEYWPREVLENIAEDPNIITEMEHLSSLIRYDPYLHGYHIHRIVLDYLREKQGELSEDDIRRSSTLAAEWCLRNNLPMDAAINYARARDYRQLVNIIYGFQPIMPQPVTIFLLDILDRLKKNKDRDGEDEDFLFLYHVTHPRLIMNMGRLEEAIAECQASIARFEALPPSPLSSHILTGCYLNLGNFSILTARFTGAHLEADYFIRANYYYMRHPRIFQGSSTKVNLPSYYITQIAYPAKTGQIEEIIENFSRAVPHAAYCFNGYLYGIDDLARAELAYFRDNLNDAERHARQAMFKGREKEQYVTENRALFYLLRIALHGREPADIEMLWKQLDAQLEIPAYRNSQTIYDITSGWFYAHIGAAEKVVPWLQNEFDDDDSGSNFTFRNYETLIKLKYLYAAGQYEKALAVLEREKNRRGLKSFLLGKIELDCLEAVIRRQTGDREGALKNLEEAWEAAASNSLTMPFIELGEDMRLLISDVLNEGGCAIPRDWLESVRSRASAYGKKLALITERYRRESSGGGGKVSEGGSVFLTRRETKILTLLSQGFNRDEIAEDTGISANYVKISIREIYRKFGAINRADAIRIAVNMKIIKDNKNQKTP
jgi:LuxR family maltose regulon positive regulatory protein